MLEPRSGSGGVAMHWTTFGLVIFSVGHVEGHATEAPVEGELEGHLRARGSVAIRGYLP
jgi:hypothetical protein